MVTSEQIAIVRAIAEGDLDRHTALRDELQASGDLADYEAALAAAFQVAVRQYLAGRYRHQDVVNLVAEARMTLDPTGVAIDPSYVELIVRSALGDPVNLGRAAGQRVPAKPQAGVQLPRDRAEAGRPGYLHGQGPAGAWRGDTGEKNPARGEGGRRGGARRGARGRGGGRRPGYGSCGGGRPPPRTAPTGPPRRTPGVISWPGDSTG